jgi:hypothetical protein
MVRWWCASGISTRGALRSRSSYMYSPVFGRDDNAVLAAERATRQRVLAK